MSQYNVKYKLYILIIDHHLTAPTWVMWTWPSQALCVTFSQPTTHTSSVWPTLSSALRKPRSKSASRTEASPRWWGTPPWDKSQHSVLHNDNLFVHVCVNPVLVSFFRILQQISSTLTCGRPGSRGVVCLPPRGARLPSSLKASSSCWTPAPLCWKCSSSKVHKSAFSQLFGCVYVWTLFKCNDKYHFFLGKCIFLSGFQSLFVIFMSFLKLF